MTEQRVEYRPRRLAWLLGRRLPRGHYIGRCTRSHHLAVLRSGRGTYCWFHRRTVTTSPWEKVEE